MPGTIIVKPIQAKLDKEERALSKLDPYCVAIIGDRHAESEVCKKGGSTPAWHDALALTRNDEPYCYLEVKDKSLLKDKMLGICAIDLDELTQQGNVQKWYELYYNKQHAGEILIEASITDVEGSKGGIEGARTISPERFSNREKKIFQTYTEGSTAQYSSAKRESYPRYEQPLGGHSPFNNNRTFDTPVSGYEVRPFSMVSAEKDRFYDSPIEPQSRIYESQSTVRDIVGTLGREFSGISNQTGVEAGYGYGTTYITRSAEKEADSNIADLQRKVDDVLRKSRLMDEERKIRESHLLYPIVEPQSIYSTTQTEAILSAVPTQPIYSTTQTETILSAIPTQPIQTHPLQDFTRQDSAVSIPNENPGNEGLPMFIDTHSELVHASHDKFLGDDSNAVSRAEEFKIKLMERVERGKNMIRERVSAMAHQDDEQSQPSLKHKVLVGVEKALAKRQGAQSERKAPKEKRYEEEHTEQSSGKGSNIKEKIFGGVEQIAHSSIKTLSKLERKMKEKRGIEEELREEREEEEKHSKSAKKETLKERVEYIKDVSREKVLARLRKPAVDEGVQTEGMYVNEDDKPGKMEVIKEKVEHIKDAAKEKVEEITHKKKGQEESEEEEVEDDRTLGEKVKDGVAKGAKKVVLKAAMKKVEKAQENIETNNSKKKKKKTVKKVKEVSPSSSSSSSEEEEEEHIPRKERVHHKKKHHHKQVSEEEEEEDEEGMVDKVKGKIEKGAKYVAIKAAKRKVLKAEEELKEPKKKEKSHSHKKRHVKEKSVSPVYSDEEEETEHAQPGKIEAIKEAIVEGVEKVKSAIQEKQVQTEVKQPKKKVVQEKHQEQGTLKQKLMQEMEQIRDFAKEKIAQFGNKETEEHETAQRMYNEYERSAEKTFEYEHMNVSQPLALNNELVDGMKDLTATLDRLQQKIEARIASQQEYNRSIGASYTYDTPVYQTTTTTTKTSDVSGTIATIKEKVKEGVEHITKPKAQESTAPPGSIAGLMDKLSEQIQEMNIDDKIYLTKEYKQTLAEEEHQKAEHREGRMRTLKLKVKEGVDQVKNLAHPQTMTHQESVTVFDTEQPQYLEVVDTVPQQVIIEQVSTMTQSQREREVDEMFDMYCSDQMIQLRDDAPKPGVVETIKQKVTEGIEQVKHMAHRGEESHQQTETPSGPIAELMDQLSEEISKPKETTVSEDQPEVQSQQKGVIEKVKEGVKNLVSKENEGQLHSGMAGSLMNADLKESESPSSTIFKYDYTKDEHAQISETEQKPSAGIVGTIKQKVMEGIERVKDLVQHHEIHEQSLEEDEPSATEVFCPHKEIARTPEGSPKKGQPIESGYLTGVQVEENVSCSEVFNPHSDLKRSPEKNLAEEHDRLAESVYVNEDTIGSIILESGRPVEYGLEAKQSDLFSFGAPSGIKYAGSREFENKPVENVMYESEYFKQSNVGFGTQGTYTLEEDKPREYAMYESEYIKQRDMGVGAQGEFDKGILQENTDIENKPIENIMYQSEYIKQRDMGFGGQGDLNKETNVFEQKMTEDKENMYQKTSFDQAFEDFTNSKTQFNW